MFIRLDQQMFYSRPSVYIFPVIFTAIFWSSSTTSDALQSPHGVYLLPHCTKKGQEKHSVLKTSVSHNALDIKQPGNKRLSVL